MKYLMGNMVMEPSVSNSVDSIDKLLHSLDIQIRM